MLHREKEAAIPTPHRNPAASHPRPVLEPRAHPRHPRRDSGDAFIRDPGDGAAHVRDPLAETLAEIYLESATSGEEQAEDVLNQIVIEDAGGPFLEEDGLEGVVEDELAPRPRR